jgi:acyl-CoA thioester hydrolase
MIELGRVTDRKPPFKYAAFVRVGFSDTDAQGVVYYGRYMPYFDLARTEYHRHLGRVHLGDVDFAMRAVTIEYVAGARFDDYRTEDDALMATAKATLVCIALNERRAVPVPQAFRDQIEAFQQ